MELNIIIDFQKSEYTDKIAALCVDYSSEISDGSPTDDSVIRVHCDDLSISNTEDFLRALTVLRKVGVS